MPNAASFLIDGRVCFFVYKFRIDLAHRLPNLSVVCFFPLVFWRQVLYATCEVVVANFNLCTSLLMHSCATNFVNV